MGSGKSTLGRALGCATALRFIDLDTYIERRFHANVRDIFARRGEEGFRDLERRMLLEVSCFENVIVACGGGTPCAFDNMEVMNATGTTVWLNASDERLWQRLRLGKHRRPLIANLSDDELRDFISTQLVRRTPFYSKAQYTFDADRLDSREMIDSSVCAFCRMLQLPINDSSI